MRKITQEQIDRANAMTWYHGLNFGEYRTVGRFGDRMRPNATLFGVMDLLADIDVTGMKCLDVGCAHGVTALGLALKGGDVSATDVGAKVSPQVSLASEIYDVSIDYKAPIFLEGIGNHFERASFDLIVCAGVMYHLLNPADVFFKLRPLLKHGGLLVMESAFSPAKEPVLVLNSETGDFSEPTTYFLPSGPAIKGLAKLASFDVLATRVCTPSRYALVGRACLPNEVQNPSPMCDRILKFGVLDQHFSYAGLRTENVSSIEYTGPRDDKFIEMNSFERVLPSHPDEKAKPLGKEVTEAQLKKFIDA